MRRIVAIAALVVMAGAAIAADRPSPDLTPGVMREGVTAADLCPVAHTARIRNVTAAVKREAYRRYGVAGNHTGYCAGEEGCEVDHLCSLEIGGSNDIGNLWPEPFAGTVWNAHVKDKLENELHRRVCAGEISPQQACRALATDWVKAYRQYLGDP